MYNLKGFYGYPSLVDNAADKVAMFGEISEDSLTYAKNKNVLSNTSSRDVILISFHSVRDEIPVGVNIEYRDQCLKLGQYLLTQANAGAITTNPAQVRQLVMAEFGDVIQNFQIGTILNDGTRNMPEWVEFELITTSEPNLINLWLSDASFSAQYDEYFIEIIHPIIPFDDFFKDPLDVRELLKAYNINEKLEEVQEKRAQYPFTFQQGFTFDYVNPRDTTFAYPAQWIAIIYGQAGNNPDIIKDVIAKELIDGSTHVREDWEAILPELFRTTEFIFTPRFDIYSVPNRDLFSGQYSPTSSPVDMLNLAIKTANGPGYSSVWTTNNYQTSFNIYKSLTFAVIGNPQNRGGMTKFSLKWPDYMAVNNDDPMANMMSPETREWSALFSRLIVAAETMDRYTSVPKNMARMIRNGVIYASAYYKNINYMVVTKHSLKELV